MMRSRRRVGRCEFSDEVFGLPPRLPRRHEVQRSRLMVQRGRGLEPQWEKRNMKHYAGLDIAVKETSVCILDETGKICREVPVATHPEDLLRILQDPAWGQRKVRRETGKE